MKKILKLLPLAFFLLFSGCKKEEPAPQLPPATQSGEGTFGAYVNGEVWVPKGRPSTFQSNFDLVYDEGYEGGTLRIKAFRVLQNDPKVLEYIQIVVINLDSEGTYSLDESGNGFVIFEDECYYKGSENDVSQDGTLEITRLDMEEDIIAGKFEFTLVKEGCDTIRVTEGRFDYKLL